MADHKRFEELYAAHRTAVFGYVVRRAADPHDAADALAETFLVAWRRLDDVPAAHERGWLLGVARRVLADQRRAGRRRAGLAATLGAQLRTDLASVELPALEDRDGLAAALGALSDADRELLTLVGWEGLDNGEISVVLGCSRNAVRIRLHRARSRLARELERRGLPHATAVSNRTATSNGATS